MEAGNIIVIAGVIGLRLLVPLLIPRFPLPALIACLVIDAADQTIFQKFSTVNLDNYQSFDKALDIYYLSIAYISTLRNWTNHAAFKISQFLFYFRLVGITLFQISGLGIFLFLFQNTFEYFFIFYTVVGLRWNPKKLSTKFLIGVAAFIWIFIKLPQEYWLHIAGLDMTDFIKVNIFSVPVDTSFVRLFVLFPWLLPLVIGATCMIILIVWYGLKRLPPPDLRFTFASRTPNKVFSPIADLSFMNLMKIKRNDFIEKIVFVGIITIIFANIFPSFQGTSVQLIFGVILIILINALFSYLLIYSYKFNPGLSSSFFLMFTINTFVAFSYAKIVAGTGNPVSFWIIIFLAYVLTLITVFYDRFKPYYVLRFKTK